MYIFFGYNVIRSSSPSRGHRPPKHNYYAKVGWCSRWRHEANDARGIYIYYIHATDIKLWDTSGPQSSEPSVEASFLHGRNISLRVTQTSRIFLKGSGSLFISRPIFRDRHNCWDANVSSACCAVMWKLCIVSGIDGVFDEAPFSLTPCYDVSLDFARAKTRLHAAA